MGYRIALEYDDMGVINPAINQAWETLQNIKEHHDLKVTFFTVPMEMRYTKLGHLTNPEFKPRLDAMREAHKQGWVEYAVHGLSHLPKEFSNLDAKSTEKRMVAVEKIFKEAELSYVKIFKAPNWLISKEAEKVIKARGYKVVKDNYYQWNLKDNRPGLIELDGKVCITHGHLQDGDGCDNGVCETADKILSLPPKTKFLFLSEVL